MDKEGPRTKKLKLEDSQTKSSKNKYDESTSFINTISEERKKVTLV